MTGPLDTLTAEGMELGASRAFWARIEEAHSQGLLMSDEADEAKAALNELTALLLAEHEARMVTAGMLDIEKQQHLKDGEWALELTNKLAKAERERDELGRTLYRAWEATDQKTAYYVWLEELSTISCVETLPEITSMAIRRVAEIEADLETEHEARVRAEAKFAFYPKSQTAYSEVLSRAEQAEADNRALGTAIDNAKKRSDADLANILELSDGLKQAEAEVEDANKTIDILRYTIGQLQRTNADLRERAGGGK